jgi:hypothetical protein
VAYEIISRLEKKLFPGLRSSITFMEVYINYHKSTYSMKNVKRLCQVMAYEKEMITTYGCKPE